MSTFDKELSDRTSEFKETQIGEFVATWFSSNPLPRFNLRRIERKSYDQVYFFPCHGQSKDVQLGSWAPYYGNCLRFTDQDLQSIADGISKIAISLAEDSSTHHKENCTLT